MRRGAAGIHAGVAVLGERLQGGTDARGKDRDAVGQKAAIIETQVGISARVVVALARLQGADQRLGGAAVAEDSARELQLREIEARSLIGRAGLGQNGRLACGDDREAPARAPGVLVLDRSDDTLVTQVVRLGQIGARGGVVGVRCGLAGIERGVGLVVRTGCVFCGLAPVGNNVRLARVGRDRENARERKRHEGDNTHLGAALEGGNKTIRAPFAPLIRLHTRSSFIEIEFPAHGAVLAIFPSIREPRRPPRAAQKVNRRTA